MKVEWNKYGLLHLAHDDAGRRQAELSHLLFGRCDLSHLSSDFWSLLLDGLTNLQLESCSTVDQLLSNLFLPDLSSVVVRNSSGFQHLPSSQRGLQSVSMEFNDGHDDETMEHLLGSLMISSAATLETLSVQGSGLTFIPKHLGSFHKLATIILDENAIPVISAGSLAFSSSTSILYLSLRSCHIGAIAPGAFRGNFRRAFVDLSDNRLTHFSADVFGGLLNQRAMVVLDKSIFKYNNEFNWKMILDIDFIFSDRFDCESDPCHLAWIIRDKRKLLAQVAFGVCSNGTAFEELDPNAFSHCPSSSLLMVVS